MTKILGMAVSVLALSAVGAVADSLTSRNMIFEGDLSFGQISRSGTAVNSSGSPLAEIEDVTTFAIGGLAAVPLGQNLLTQIEVDLEGTDYPSSVGGEDADDTYDASGSLGLQFGYQFDQGYVGGFAGLGTVDSSDTDGEQDADYTIAGLGGQWATGDWLIGAQAGQFDSDAEDPETPSDVTFGRIIGQRFFNDGQSKLLLDVAFAEGEQDADSDTPDEMQFTRYGMEFEQMLGVDMFGGTTSVYGSAYHLDIAETDEDGDIDRANDLSVGLGMRIRFGANSLQDRALGTAPDLPDVARWIGATPVLD
ncbi:hypothetical protein SLH49_05475 [Cognatiyoonia sp. IB215446]|uniref:hypothetical protein n=1 Tax=Cognatiyoonia sp. IB215446 TaxID=3097355 RepID=UPI002A121995|nr:hypothetical protein [Cognatiyoonia sp. IB215446]MDX8347432.1 hypothetical protein [Cognatiyoonia sp. IB215446]